MRIRSFVLFGAAVAFGAVLADARSASALVFKRAHAVNCWWDNMQSGGVLFAFGGLSIRNDAAGSSTLICPAIDDTALPKSQQTTLTVNGYDGNATVNANAYACVTYATTEGGECGPVASSSGVGNFSLPVNTLRWQLNDAHYGFLYVQVPPKDSSSGVYSTFRGYYTSKP
jgi:hypothetical protein